MSSGVVVKLVGVIPFAIGVFGGLTVLRKTLNERGEFSTSLALHDRTGVNVVTVAAFAGANKVIVGGSFTQATATFTPRMVALELSLAVRTMPAFPQKSWTAPKVAT